jgi:hypothetical protein
MWGLGQHTLAYWVYWCMVYMGPRATHIYNAICIYGIDMPFKGLFLQRSMSLGPKGHICFSPTSLGPISQNLVRVCRLTLELPLRGSFRRGQIWTRSRSLRVKGQNFKKIVPICTKLSTHIRSTWIPDLGCQILHQHCCLPGNCLLRKVTTFLIQ